MAVIPHAAILYKSRHKIENMFARLKDWRRVETRYDRCADLFLSACTLAAVVMFWLWVLTLALSILRTIATPSTHSCHLNRAARGLSKPE